MYQNVENKTHYLATAMTVAPQTFPICTAARPTPPAAPKTNNTCNTGLKNKHYTYPTKSESDSKHSIRTWPEVNWALWTSATWEVPNATASAPAATRSQPGGTRNLQSQQLYTKKLQNPTLKGSRRGISQLGLVNDDELSEWAEAGEGTNGVPDSEVRNFGANSVDVAGKIGAWYEGQRGFLLIRAQYLQVIGEVQACGFDSDSYSGGRIELGNWVILWQNYWAIVVFQTHRWITQFSAQ